MSIRAFIAALVAAALLAAGDIFLLRHSGVTLADFLNLLLHGAPDGSLLCRLAGWGAVIFAALTILASLLLFAANEDEDDRPPPGWVALILLLVSLVFFWFALRCAAPNEAAPAAPPVVKQTVAPPPAPAETPPPAPQKPAIETQATAFKWTYMIPLIDPDGAYHQSAAMARALDQMFAVDDPDGSVRAMLCGKAWVAFTGSSSEEGPFERNERRARVRADLALAAARKWLAAHPDCDAPILFGVDLGQHIPTVASTPETTAYQRQILVLSRNKADADETLTPGEAEDELSAFLADKDQLIRFLAGRRFLRAPHVYLAEESPS